MKTLLTSLLLLALLTTGHTSRAALQKAHFSKANDKVAQHERSVHAHPKATDFFTVSALRNHDGSTDILLNADPYAPDLLPQLEYDWTPRIKKVTLKIFSEAGKLQKTEVITVGHPTILFKRWDLKRHQTIQATAVVENIVTYDPHTFAVVKRSTAVMSDTAIVNNRPDLAVIHVDAPATPEIGVPYTIDITLQEVGGDLPGNGLCYADMRIAYTNEYFGVTDPTFVAVDPGQTVVCRLFVIFRRSGSYDIKAEVVPPALAQYNFTKEDYLTNNERFVPVDIATPPDVNYISEGFVVGGVVVSHRVDHRNTTGTFTNLTSSPAADYYYEDQGTFLRALDRDSARVSASGLIAGRWPAYPLDVSYQEYGGDGAMVVSVTGASNAPISSSSEYLIGLDPINGLDWFYRFDEHELDLLTDDATGTLLMIDSYKSTRLDTGEVMILDSRVSASRTLGHEVFLNTLTGGYRYDPDEPFIPAEIISNSIVVYPLEVPANMTGSYRVALGLVDAEGFSYQEEATVPIPQTNAYSDYQPYTCGGYSFTLDDGYHVEHGECSTSLSDGFLEYGSVGFP